MRRKAYSPSPSDSAYQTTVTPEMSKGLTNPSLREKQVVLPEGAANVNTHPTGTPSFNTPSSPVPARTKGIPGGDEHPYNDPGSNVVTRRVKEGYRKRQWTPQHHQTGLDRRKDQRYYRRNKSKIRQRAKKWYQRVKRNPQYQRAKSKRRDNPGRYHRRYAAEGLPFPVLWGEAFLPLWVVHLLPEEAVLQPEEGGEPYLVSWDRFFSEVAFEEEEDVDQFLDLAESHGVDLPDMELQEVSRTAADTFYYEKYPTPNWEKPEVTTSPNPTTVDNWSYDPKQPQTPAGGDPVSVSPDYMTPGSGKVIPDHLKHASAAVIQRSLTAASIRDLVHKTDPSLASRDVGTVVSVGKGVYRVGDYDVRVKGSKARIFVSCTCPFFRWQGPEYWARTEDYLLGAPTGELVSPQIKDPKGVHKLCKHLVKVMKSL